MRRALACLLAVLWVIAHSHTALAAEEVPVGELVSNGSDYSGREVVVVGELVGDYGFRPEGWMWTQLNGDPYARAPLRETDAPRGSNVAIGVRMRHELGEVLDPPGGYRYKGPLVEVVGEWKYHDAELAGESYLEVESLEVVTPGRPLTQPMNPWALGVGLVLAGLSAALWRAGRR